MNQRNGSQVRKSQRNDFKRVAARQGYTHSKETRNKIAAKRIGEVWSEERRLRFAEVRRGAQHSAATIEKMRKAALRRWRRIRKERITK